MPRAFALRNYSPRRYNRAMVAGTVLDVSLFRVVEAETLLRLTNNGSWSRFVSIACRWPLPLPMKGPTRHLA